MVVVLSLLRVTGHAQLARRGAMQLALCYSLLVVFGNLIITCIIVGVGEKDSLCQHTSALGRKESESCDFGATFYYTWMTFHSRAYGDIIPVTSLEECLA